MSRSRFRFCPPPDRAPRAGVDPITSDGAVRPILDELCPPPLRDEVLAIMLDTQRRGTSILQVSGTYEPEALLRVAAWLARTKPAACAAVVLVSSRPTLPVEFADIELWFEASAVLGDAGIVLAEWYVVSDHGVEHPRDLIGEPPRWSPS